VHACHPLGKLCTCFHLDIGPKAAQNVVEECNLFVRIVAGTGCKKIGDAIDDSKPVTGAGCRKRADKLIEHRPALRESIGRFGVRTDWHRVTAEPLRN
jgi:hypothetical protein